MDLLLASGNRKKLAELSRLVADLGVRVLSPSDVGALPEVDEDGATFEANAGKKARAWAAAAGLACIADDSGLEVDALGGAPGVYSKRFSPEQTHEANNALLLCRLEGVGDRRARFRCVLAVVDGERQWTVDGRCEGEIGHGPRGEHGFGYDPLFLPDEAPGRSLAELSMSEKNRISHRGRAFVALASCLG